MRERPVLFSDPMVRAILEGRKTQTRRVIKPTSRSADGVGVYGNDDGDSFVVTEVVNTFAGEAIDAPAIACPYGAPGDRLWVREAWQVATGAFAGDLGAAVRYRDTEVKACWMPPEKPLPLGLTWNRWRPSIHMPRWASRLTLEVKSVRVERLQAITEEDARAEGVAPAETTDGDRSHVLGFVDLWDSISAARGFGWDANPWVWVVGFERVEGDANAGHELFPRASALWAGEEEVPGG